MSNIWRALLTSKTFFVLLITICLCTFLFIKFDILHLASLKVVVENKSNIQIDETRILYYYTTFDSKTGKQGIGEKIVYEFPIKINPNESKKFYPDFEVSGEGGLGIAFIDKSGNEYSKYLCSYIESAPIGKFIITIEDDGKLQVKDDSFLLRACY